MENIISKYSNNDLQNNIIIFNSYKILPNNILKLLSEYNTKYPKTFKDVDINGNDLMEFGYKGQEVGTILNKILVAILSDKLKNNKSEILKFVSNEKR